MKSINLNRVIIHLLSCGKFSALEIFWITGTGTSRQRAKVRQWCEGLVEQNLACREFDEILNKTVIYIPHPKKIENPYPANRDIVYKIDDRNELIDFLRSIYKKFGFLPDKVSDSTAYYYATDKKIPPPDALLHDLISVPHLPKEE